MSETWKPVLGFPGYEVSDLGRVRSWLKSGYGTELRSEPRVLKPWTGTRGGYHAYRLSNGSRKRQKFAHVLVLEAFVGPCPPGLQCRHFPDRSTSNNCLDNLSWGTPEENGQDRVFHGTQARGDQHGSVTMPHRVPRGDRHKSRTRPESVARGDSHGSRTCPHRLARGDRNGSRSKPEALHRGSMVHSTHLLEGDVRIIKMLCGDRVDSDVAIAKAFRVTSQAVGFIKRGQTWRHVA